MINEAGESVLYFDSVGLQEVRDEHLQKAWKRWSVAYRYPNDVERLL